MFVARHLDLQFIVRRAVEHLGFELVDLEVSGRSGLLRVFIDRPQGFSPPAPLQGSAIALDDCVLVSNHLTRVLEVELVDYGRLEVSSPGLDRPLKARGDFERFSGARATVTLRLPLNGRKRFSGTLMGLDGQAVVLVVDGSPVQLPLMDIDKARLVPDI